MIWGSEKCFAYNFVLPDGYEGSKDILIWEMKG